MWPWVNIQAIQIGIKLQSVVVFRIMPSMKQIDLQLSCHIMMLNTYFIKSPQQSSLP